MASRGQIAKRKTAAWPPPRRRRHDWPLDLVLPVFLVLAFHALLLYLFRLAPLTNKTEAASRGSECVALLPQSDKRLPAWEQKLYRWAVLEDPTILTLPHEKLGFSRVLQKKITLPVPLIPAYEYTISSVREAPMPPVELTRPPPPLALALQQLWQPAPWPMPPPLPVTPLPRGVFWRFPDGKLLQAPPEIAPKEITAALEKAPLPKNSTLIEIDRTNSPGMTRIVVRRTCGNPTLDELAVHALRRRITDLELHAATAGTGLKPTADRQPEWLPSSGKRRLVEVEWDLVAKTIATAG